MQGDRFDIEAEVSAASSRSLLRTGRRQLREGAFGAASVSFGQLVEMAPELPAAQLGLAAALVRLDRHREAVAPLQAAVALDPERAELRLRLGRTLMRCGELVEAEAVLRSAVSLDETHREAHHVLARTLAKTGRFVEAVGSWNAANSLTDADSDGQLQRGLAHALARIGALDAAEAALERAAELDARVIERAEASGEGIAGPGSVAAAQRLLAWRAALAASLSLVEVLGAEPADSVEVPWPFGSRRPAFAPDRTVAPRARVQRELTVVVPTYEPQPVWLVRCLDSVVTERPNADDTDILVVDDSSSGAEVSEIVSRYRGRVRYLHNESRLGLAGNFNNAVALAAGRFVHLLHQDDWIEPGFYGAVLPSLLDDHQLVAGFTHTRIVTGDHTDDAALSRCQPVAGRWDGALPHLSQGVQLRCPAMVVRRATYEAVGGFCEQLDFATDWDMWARLAASGPIWYDPRGLANFRVHSGSETSRIERTRRLVDVMHAYVRIAALLPEAERRCRALFAFDLHLNAAARDVFAAARTPEGQLQRAQLLGVMGFEPSDSVVDRALQRWLRAQTGESPAP